MVVGVVGDDPRLAQPDADLVEALGEKGQVRVLRAARQDLVADDQDAGGNGRSMSARPRSSLPRTRGWRCGLLHRQSRARYNTRRAGKCRGGLSRARRHPTFGDGSSGAAVARASGSDYHPGARPGDRAIGEQRALGDAAGRDGRPQRGAGKPRPGQIKLHGPDAFEGMRKAGALAAAMLDFITPYVKPGVDDRRARPAVPRLHPRPRRDFGAAQLPRLSANRSAPRSTMSSATASPATAGWSTATSSIST